MNQQVELNHVKYNNLQLNTELEHHRNLMHMQERKIIQLKESLKAKSIALDSLEETYKQTRNSENTLLMYLKENECIVNSTITAHQNLQKENQNMRMELKKVAERVEQLKKENKEVCGKSKFCFFASLFHPFHSKCLLVFLLQYHNLEVSTDPYIHVLCHFDLPPSCME